MAIRGICFGLAILLSNVSFAVPSKNILIGKVVKVQDGDTITVLTADNQEERIRLFWIMLRCRGGTGRVFLNHAGRQTPALY